MFHECRAIFLRRYKLQYVALELFLASRSEATFIVDRCDLARVCCSGDHVCVREPGDCEAGRRVFATRGRRRKIRAAAEPQNVAHVASAALQTLRHGERRARARDEVADYRRSLQPDKWQRREISNFDYLMFLNTIAGRSYNGGLQAGCRGCRRRPSGRRLRSPIADLHQTPIFPWIIRWASDPRAPNLNVRCSNYESATLDLGDASNFRDLSKVGEATRRQPSTSNGLQPVGALSEARRAHFQERFNNWDDESVPAFYYGLWTAYYQAAPRRPRFQALTTRPPLTH